MSIAAVIWLVQDFMQVFSMGICIVPDIFLFSVLLLALTPGSGTGRQSALIWAAFAGGLLWDLRWTNLPGLTAAINGAAVAAACHIWHKVPAQARTVTLFVIISGCAHLLSGIIHFCFWTIPSQAAIRQLAVQQLLAVPALIVVSLVFWRLSDKHA